MKMPICQRCKKIFRKTGVGRGSSEKLCSPCWFIVLKERQRKRKKKKQL